MYTNRSAEILTVSFGSDLLANVRKPSLKYFPASSCNRVWREPFSSHFSNINRHCCLYNLTTFIICHLAQHFSSSLIILPAATVICYSQQFTSNKAQCRTTKERRQWANKLGGRLNNCGLSAVRGKHNPVLCMCYWLRLCICVCSCWQQTWETKVSQLRASPVDCSCCWYLNLMQVLVLWSLWSCHCCAFVCNVSTVHK